MGSICLLYIGNKLSIHGKNESGVEFTGKILERRFILFSCSDKINPISRFFDSLANILRFYKKVDYCLLDVYSSSNFYFTFSYAVLLKILKVRYITNLHGGDLPRRLAHSPVLSKFLFGKAHILVSPSNYLKNEFGKKGYQPVLIPNSLPIKNYPFKPRQDFKPRLLYVRAFHKVYNPEMAVELVNILRQNGTEAKLTMVGPDKDGSLKKCEAMRAEYSLENSIEFKGYMAKKEWIQLSENFDFFINTTDFDNTPVSVMEAMALGLIVISTNVGGLPYLISHEKNGFMVPPKNPSQMADQILTALKNPDMLIQIAGAARKTVEEFDEEIVLQKWMDILKN